ncbi:MAG: hypothetical protein ACOZNI_12130 [Myxococcota bacterium]
MARILDRLLGLGPADEPRRIAVSGRRAPPPRPVVSTPGARVRVSRDGRDGEIGRLVLWLHRRGEPVELLAGENRVWLDGVEVTPDEVRRRL